MTATVTHPSAPVEPADLMTCDWCGLDEDHAVLDTVYGDRGILVRLCQSCLKNKRCGDQGVRIWRRLNAAMEREYLAARREWHTVMSNDNFGCDEAAHAFRRWQRAVAAFAGIGVTR